MIINVMSASMLCVCVIFSVCVFDIPSVFVCVFVCVCVVTTSSTMFTSLLHRYKCAYGNQIKF